MKKIKRSEPGKIIDLIINKELYHHNVTIEDVRTIEDWFTIYTFDSPEIYQEWKDFCIDLMVNKITPKFSIKQANKEFVWIDLMWGLKHNY